MKYQRVRQHASFRLSQIDPRYTGDYKRKDDVADRTEHLRYRLGKLQGRLYAEKSRAVLVVLQGVDAAGKDGAIRHVMNGLSPLGCSVASFKAPTAAEKAHDFLWRVHAVCPPLGSIGIFNRSHYEDVLITQVHQWIAPKEIKRRLEQIRNFEKMLTDNGTRILKLFLHISKSEQKERFLARLKDSDKRWKFDAEDLRERQYWKRYQTTYEQVIAATSTKECPWFVVPADHKWYRNLLLAEILVDFLEDLNPRAPKFNVSAEDKLRRNVMDA